MHETIAREHAEAVMRKALCAYFLAVDGTITMRPQHAPDAAKAITSRLRSQGFLKSGLDGAEMEQAICRAMHTRHEASASFSVPASLVASRIYDAIYSATRH